MNRSSAVHQSVMASYDADRRKADALFQARLSEVYTKVPRAAEIDERLKHEAVRLSRLVLAGSVEEAGAIRKGISSLRQEKAALLQRADIPGDYLTTVYTCNICKDTGYAENAPCPCMKRKLIARYYDMAGLKDKLEAENFDTFDLSYYAKDVSPEFGVSPWQNIQAIYKTCLNFVNNFDTDFQNLLFYGGTGLGKTFLCSAVAKDLLDAGKSVLYVTAPAFFKQVEQSRFGRDESAAPDEQLKLAYDADLFVLDDLGSEFPTIVTTAALFDVLNSRLLDKRPTVISTNLSFADFQNQYSDRIVSRIFGGYLMLRFFGDDIRILKKIGKP